MPGVDVGTLQDWLRALPPPDSPEPRRPWCPECGVSLDWTTGSALACLVDGYTAPEPGGGGPGEFQWQ